MAITASEVDSGRQQVGVFADRVRAIRTALHEVVVGQDDVIDQLLVCALTGSHALVVGVPGLAKTLMVKALAAAFRWKYGRIQFTPDLMPADVTGYELLGRGEDGQDRRWPSGRVRCLPTSCWPTRSTARAEDAIGPAGGDGRAARHGGWKDVSLGRAVLCGRHAESHRAGRNLPAARGTVGPLHEEIRISYPTPEQEEEIVLRTTAGMPKLPEASLDREEFLQLRDLVLAVPAANNVAACAVRLCGLSRPEDPRSSKFVRDYVAWGAGPRGSQNLVLAAKARALLLGRAPPSPRTSAPWPCPSCATGSS